MFGTASLSVCTLCFKEDTCQSGTILPVSLMKTRKKTEGSFLMAVLFIKSSLGSDSCLLVLSLYHLVMLPVLQISSQLSVMSLLSPVLWSITLSTKNDTNTDYVSHFNLSLLFFFLLFQHTAFKYLTTVTGWVVSSNFYCFFGDYDEGLQRLTGKTSRVVVCGYFMPAPSLPKSQSSPPEPQKNALINHPSANP